MKTKTAKQLIKDIVKKEDKKISYSMKLQESKVDLLKSLQSLTKRNIDELLDILIDFKEVQKLENVLKKEIEIQKENKNGMIQKEN